jgi:hypothetical protein
VNWQAIFDDQPVSSIGALAVAPSDPGVVWAGTGEAFIRSNISLGWGVFRSIDAGRTWTRAGLEATGRIGRIVVDPRDPDVALACALGTAYGPQPDRGVFRTSDGGKTWAKTLFVDEKTGCSDLVMDPNNPRVLFAGMWQLEIHTWGRESGGTRERDVSLERRRGHLEARRRQRPASEAVGKGRPGHDARELGPRLRAHRSGRRPALEGERHAERPPLALGRRGREVGAHDRRPAGRGAHALLQPHGRRARRSGRGRTS